MNRSTKRKIIPALYFLLFGIISLPVFGEGVQISAESDQGITFEFQPQNWRIEQKPVNGVPYFQIKFDNCNFDTKYGEPLLPERVLIFAIPPNARVSMDMVDAEKDARIHGKPLPTPTFAREGLGKIEYAERENVYNRAAVFPEKLVHISPISFLREQHVVIVRISPARFFPEKEFIQLYKRVVIRLNFSGGVSAPDKYQPIGNDNFYSRVLVNSEQAVKWRFSKKQKILQKESMEKNEIGEWFKIFTRDEGIYKITGTDLENAGIVLSLIDPANLKIYNNGGFKVPTLLNDSRPDSLIENAILVDDGGDGRFDTRDYFLFYGKPVNDWKYDPSKKIFSHYLHPFTRENVYWLNWQREEPGKRMKNLNLVPGVPVSPVTSFFDFVYVENEYKNLLNSGIHWFGNYFSNSLLSRNYQFNLEGAIPNQKAIVRVNLVGVSQGKQSFRLYFNDNFIGQVPEFYASSGRLINMRMKEFSATVDGGLLDGYNKITVEYAPLTETALAYMDWIELSLFRQLTAQKDELVFFSPDSAGFFLYRLTGFSAEKVKVFDITQFSEVKRIANSQWQDGIIEFIDSTSSEIPKKYIAVAQDKFKTPEKIETDINSSLRNRDNGADFIIITYDDFYDAALGLKSLRENCDTLKTEVVKISDIYDEFSWGLPDVAAIRDFIHFVYFNWAIRPSYVLLFGDGDYDYKNILSPHDPNWIPTFETAELDEGSNRARDDWFVCVAGDDNLLDMAIGRIPVQNPDEAFKVVEKIVNYETYPDIGDWCNTITMVADDELESGGDFDGIDHIPDAETIAENYIPKSYNMQKIYLTEFPAVADVATSGIRKPAAQQALINQVNRGNLVVNFIGHGNERVWAHENVLNISDDLPRINNGQRQAFWIAATCNFGRFDNPAFQSFAEELVNLSGRGAIAVFSSSRLAIPYANVRLNKEIYEHFFKSPYQGIRIGDVVTAAKNAVGNNENDQSYHLLGDPALRIVRPSCVAQISSYSPDSIKALCKMNISGTVKLLNQPETEPQGAILLRAFDSRKDRIYTFRGGRQYHYKLPGNTIFRGEVSMTNGEYTSQFIIPKDITYGGSDGRVSIFYCDNTMFGAGYMDGLPVGGTEVSYTDTDGPQIFINFEGQNFMSGGFVEPNSVLDITMADELSGVNIVGDIGHKITMILDEEEEKKVDLTDYFQYDMDSYLSGKIVYPLENLAEGLHTISVKAWDNYNNSAQVEAEFTVVNPDEMVIRDVLNYPNPFSSNTEFTFWVNHACEVGIKIFTLSGRLVKKLENLWAETGFNHFAWDGRDADGDFLANGVYLYKIKTSCQQGNKTLSTHKIERCVILK